MKSYRPLSANALKQIDRHDYQVFRNPAYLNKNLTRFYKWLVRDGNDVEVRTVAVKSLKDGTVCIKEVVRGSVDSSIMFAIDIASVPMNGYVVDWSREKLGRKHYWDYCGQWGDYDFSYKAAFRMPWVAPINASLLKTMKRFKWCAYTRECGCVLSYLKLYAKHPRVELLVKAGLYRFAVKPSFVKQLEGNKAFMRFFSQHLDEITDKDYTIDVIRMAFKRGIPLADAHGIKMRSWFFVQRDVTLPAGISSERAYQYVHEDGKKNNLWNYQNYLRDCARLGLDFTDTKVAFPKNLKRREKIVREMVEEIERRQKVEEQKKMDTAVATMAQKLVRLEACKGPFKVVIPKCEQDFRDEGKKLNHCIGYGCYVSGFANGEMVIAFIRKPKAVKVPFVTLEFSPSTGKVTQCYGKKNSKPEKRVLDFVHGAFTKAAKRIAKAI